jgi:hypothetical protein
MPLISFHTFNTIIATTLFLLMCIMNVARFDSRHYQKENVESLERGPLSLVSTTEELFDRKVAARLENREYGRRDPSR